MNPNTLVAVCGYAGDRHQIVTALPLYQHHECPIIVFSPKDSPALVIGKRVKNHLVGRAAYIGQTSLDRQRRHLEILLKHPFDWFFLNDSDSFCLAREFPAELYKHADMIWSSEVTEPRPHASPYPKLAFQPPYFFSRSSAERMLAVADRITAHPITPYIDWYMVALACEAGLQHRPFTYFEHAPRKTMPFTGADPWDQLAYRIAYQGAVFMHPIKTPEQVKICVDARKFYEST